MNPIDVKLAQDIAVNSDQGKDGKLTSLMNSTSILYLQVENSIGKACIGISAVGSKVITGLLNHYNNLIYKISKGNSEALTEI